MKKVIPGKWLLSLLICCAISAFSSVSAHARGTITMSIDSNYLGVDIVPSSQNGTFASSSINIDVSVNGTGGYTLGIQSSTSNTDLVNQADNTKTITSIASTVPVLDFSADNSTAATNYNGKWGYLPSKYDSTENTVYRPAPDNTGDVLDATYGRNEQGQYAISIGARAGADTAAGIYNNTFVITVVSNYSCSIGEICYDDNGSDDGLMDNQAIPSGATEIMLAGNNYSREGYGFAGWSTAPLDPDDPDFASNLASATVYGPMETITIPQAGWVELNAVWVPSEGNMQAWNGCSGINIGDVTALTDTRDGNTYAIAKLVDGACWQIENIRLDFSDENTELTNLNTNHATAYFMGLANDHPAQVQAFDSDRYSTDIKYINKILDDNYIFGVYYNWQTLRGGNGHVGGGNSANGDICPAGWSVPRSANDAYLAYLNAIGGTSAWQYNSTTSPTGVDVISALRSFPNNFILNKVISTNELSQSNGIAFYPTDYVSNYADTRGANFSGLGIYNNSSNGLTVFRGAFNTTYSFNGYSFRCIVGSSESYTLTYDANGGTGAPADETITSTSGIFNNITTTEPTRNGYTFIGWVDKDGIEVQPGGSYNAGIGNTNAKLYALWTNNSCNSSATTIDTGNSTDAVCLQDVNGAVRNAMANANTVAGSIQTFQLVDARDNRSYDIALLDDGNVWMTKNLNLGEGRTIALSHYDTNLPDTQSFILRASGVGDTESYRFANYNGEQNDGLYDGVYYGGYYAWNAATVSDLFYYANTNRTTSICPAGWDLPSSVHYTNLASEAGLTNSVTASASPYSFTLGGYVRFSTMNGVLQYSFNNRGSRGDYWTSTGSTYGNNYASELLYATGYYITSSAFSSSNSRSKNFGQNVRCILKNGTAAIHYDGNGNAAYPTTGSMPTQTAIINTGNIAANSFVRANYAFKGWNTQADGNGTDVNVGASIYEMGLEDGDEITLYAQWEPKATIIHNDNYSDKTYSTQITAGVSTTLGSYNYFTTKTGYSIKEWNTEPDGSGTTYAVSSSYTAPANLSEPITITLYAQWVEDCTITFVNTITGETQTKSIKWNKNGTIAPTTTWTYTNYRMIGWDTVTNAGTDGGGTVVYSNGTSITPTNDLTVYTVWVPIYYIQYNGNGASNTTNMAIVHEVEENSQVTLYASNFIRSGYGFVGWSFNPDAANDLSNATVYGPNATITTPTLTTPGETKTLYAVWVPAESGVTMQTFDDTASPYDSALTGTVIALTDSRDNDTYAVAKLADGKWWMIENLRLGGTSSMTLYNTDTAITASSITLPASMDTFSTADYDYMQINTANKNNTVISMNNANENVYSYGVYYSWNAAISSDYTSGVTSTVSICPYGWHLPSGGYNGEFDSLNTILGGGSGTSASIALRAYPNNFIKAGYKSGSSVASAGSSGCYWSNRDNSNNQYKNAYYLVLNETTVYTTSTSSKASGRSIRCIAD